MNDQPPTHKPHMLKTIAHNAVLASTYRFFGIGLADITDQAAVRGPAGSRAGLVIFYGMGSMAMADAAGPSVVGTQAVAATAADASSRPVRPGGRSVRADHRAVGLVGQDFQQQRMRHPAVDDVDRIHTAFGGIERAFDLR